MTSVKEKNVEITARWSSKCSTAYRKMTALLVAYDYYCLMFAVLVIWCFVYREYFLFDSLFLFDKYAVDTISQFYPVEYFCVKNALERHIPFWSFQFGLGSNVYFLSTNFNPFHIVYWFFGTEQFSQTICLVILLKFLATSVFFYSFLKKINISLPLSLVGALAYTFSGYMILNSHWYNYPNNALFFAMFLYFFELWYQNNIWVPLVLLFGLVPLKIEYQILQIAFFGFFYILYRVINTIGVNKKIFLIFLRIIFFGALGLLIWSFFLVPDLCKYAHSSRATEAVTGVVRTSFMENLTQIIHLDDFIVMISRFFSPDALSSWLNYGIRNYFENSSMYTGIAAFICFFIPFFLHDKQCRILFIFPLIISMVLIFPYIRMALVVFVTTSFKHLSLYCGFYPLLTSLILLNIFFDRFSKNNIIIKIKQILFISYIIVFIIFVFIIFHERAYNFKFNIHRLAVSIFLVSLFCFSLFFYNKKNTSFIQLCVCVIMVIDIIISARVVIRGIPGKFMPFLEQRKEIYFDVYTMQAINYIYDHDDSFFRIEKSYAGFGLNDAMIQEYFGTKLYMSFTENKFYPSYGLTQSYGPYAKGLEGNKQLQDLLMVKYFLCKEGSDCGNLSGFSPLATFGNVQVYRNEQANDFGQMFYAQMHPDTFQKLSLGERYRTISNVVVNSETVSSVAQLERTIPEPPGVMGEDKFRLTSWNEENFVGDITVTKPGILFFPIPHDIGWQAKVDGKKTPLLRLNFAFFGLPMTTLGDHHIELRYRPPFMILGWVLTAIGLLITLLLWRSYPRISPY